MNASCKKYLCDDTTFAMKTFKHTQNKLRKKLLQQRYFNRQKACTITPFGLEKFILKKTDCKV